MSFDPSTLELFIRIASTGAFGKSGREFGLSPTAATQRIQALETSLGVKLFNRTTRAVALTADGEVFLEHAHRIVANVEDALSDLSGGVANIKGNLRIAGSASYAGKYLAPYITAFLRQYPDVRIRLDVSDSVVDIVEQGYDLALRIGTQPSSSLVARKLVDNPRLLVASPAYLTQSGCPQHPNDLMSHNCLVLAENRIWKLRKPDGELFEVRAGGNFNTNYGEVITQAALSDAGIALKSLWDVRDLLDSGSLVSVMKEYSVVPVWGLWVVRPPGPIVPARVRVFIDFMLETFEKLDLASR